MPYVRSLSLCSVLGLIRVLLVLRRLCRYPHGMLWAGDTAQTIFPGSTFTFNELKALMHRAEVCFCCDPSTQLLWITIRPVFTSTPGGEIAPKHFTSPSTAGLSRAYYCVRSLSWISSH